MTPEFNTIAWIFCSVLVSLAFLMNLIRIFKGPSLSDRIVSIDLVAAILMVVFMATGVIQNNEFLLSVALAIAIVVFFATVALAKYMNDKEDLK
ncbi:MAG: monovalent cation/H+ antiporter complex subunit F [Opitutales bacterium]|nr:monovalent cation/H+ antiporter complex subunit F [Opitutales bacterium]